MPYLSMAKWYRRECLVIVYIIKIHEVLIETRFTLILALFLLRRGKDLRRGAEECVGSFPYEYRTVMVQGAPAY